MTRAYYNEIDPHAAQWLRNLIEEDLIADGDIDERSITEVAPSDLRGYTQCHFFAGIGVWPYAMRLAGIPDFVPIWTGSCPCQSFSVAGKQKGKEDERHLWPAFFNLIRECRPVAVVGEQVENAIRHGWLDDLQDDLEGIDYACGAIVLPACGVGAYHIRQRLYWVAHSSGERLAGWRKYWNRPDECGSRPGGVVGGMADSDIEDQRRRGIQRPGESDSEGDGSACERSAGLCADGWMADPLSAGRTKGWAESGDGSSSWRGELGGMADANGRESWETGSIQPGGEYGQQPEDGGVGWMADASSQRRQQVSGSASRDEATNGREGRNGREQNGDHIASGYGQDGRPSPPNSIWSSPDWLFCRDGKWRPAQSGIQPLVDGTAQRMVRGGDQSLPIDADNSAEARVMRLRGYGNAIVAPLAAEFIKAVLY